MRSQVRARFDPGTTSLASSAAWHERLATIHVSPADPITATLHAAESERQAGIMTTNLAAWERSNGRDVASKERAGRAYREATQRRHLAHATGAPVRPKAHVTHAVAAAQIRALDAKEDVTEAAGRALLALAAHEHPGVAAAARAHPT